MPVVQLCHPGSTMESVGPHSTLSGDLDLPFVYLSTLVCMPYPGPWPSYQWLLQTQPYPRLRPAPICQSLSPAVSTVSSNTQTFDLPEVLWQRHMEGTQAKDSYGGLVSGTVTCSLGCGHAVPLQR